MNRLLFMTALLFASAFSRPAFSDVAIYVTNQNEDPVEYSVIVPPTMSIDGNQSGQIEGGAEKSQLMTIASEGENPAEEFVELKFHDGAKHFLCSSRFFYEKEKLDQNPAASNDRRSKCSVEGVYDGFHLTVSKRVLQADYTS